MLRLMRDGGEAPGHTATAFVRHLAASGCHDPESVRMAALLLAPLAREDAGRNSDLIATLRAYYACGARVDRTAEILFLHRNSVRYRLDRIRLLTGLDIDQPTVIAALMICLAMQQTTMEERDAGQRAQ